ncbi:trifunctional transcriptional regulator/proline dehydrogenase/L-glutamate gamma-semialdehyde dehydrogenase [Solimicrobium silvestre]|uniref:Bifunctional protein PutA n=1 Tax=Solimicrobium silvestre TaxID=2099400 RepID=A0A2S9GS95_9BURK|nr:trifunctional transcriptional regulator/proline dehydrogenase/L-glutamate gamma-semialdehyde dehydrogenase [Solimicrobium silvestre]PRC90580.1 D1pyr5carbox3: delta-1-pyrroline-5-carboxylate dehydrogenase [Solimicrobium silvestre]
MTQPFTFLHSEVLAQPTALRLAITNAYRPDEAHAVQTLLDQLTPFDHAPIQVLAKKLVKEVREQRTRASGVDALMHEFSLSSEEGVALMCLAEALLRIPDHQTVDRLIADKISKGDWRKHLGESPSLFVNAATWGLLVTGKLVSTNSERGLASALSKLISKGGEPLIRKGVDLAMRMLGNQFVTGQTIEEALKNSQENEKRGYRYSYDMLGEAALTAKDAAFYFSAYETAIHAIGRAAAGRGIKNGPGISVKLSALHPRYSRAQRSRVMEELLPGLKKLLVLAKQYNIGFNIDAEEADRLELSLDLIEALAFDADLAGFEGLGIVIQAYQKRCPYVLDFLIDLARRSKQKFMVRLVKGAYWDSEIKRAQVDGMSGYPVYTRKVYTDVSYLLCAQKLLAATDVIYPQFATHNALTLATIYTWAEQQKITDYEFQCLHGMGETLYDKVVGADKLNRPCRIYAPVGSHETLLAYLVRRLLENGANSSFVNQIVDESISLDSLVENPITVAEKLAGLPHSGIHLPLNLFGQERKNSAGFDFSNEQNLRVLSHEITQFSSHKWHAKPLLHGIANATTSHVITNPALHTDIVGHVIEANSHDLEIALQAAATHANEWNKTLPKDRAACLNKAADLLESNHVEFIALAIREAGKSFPNAVAEVREAVDFLRYYAAQILVISTTNALGPVVCISPWNFPLAIFLGEVSAALAVGNVVLAKPAEQTPLIAFRAIQLLHKAGIPTTALQFLPGRGETVGAKLVADIRVKGVIFTGSTEVAQLINQTLAKRSVAEQCEIPLIAETGGQNALIVDSSALPEQVVQDVLSSAFDSAGQRCSALRVLCLQHDIFDKTMQMLYGAMQELRIGNPDRLSIDIGPVIDLEAKNKLLSHIDELRPNAISFHQLPLSEECNEGHFVAPTVIEISSLAALKNETFGPVLHVIRYKRDELPQLIEQINQTGYGLTLGVHSRIDETIQYVIEHAHVGNIYVNRNIVGAVVGVQPFGGEGKSGTGPKAGGPLYLKRLQQHSNDQIHGHSVFERPSSDLLNTLLVWLKTHGHEKLAVFAEHYALTTPRKMSLVLPGPTGERNTLAFAPRGRIFCAASNVNTLLNQLAAVLATENIPVMSNATLSLIPASLPDIIKNAIQVSEVDALLSQVALIETSLLASLRPVIAFQEEWITTVVETSENEVVPLWRLLAERAVCINTTAAGGNASLMTLNS